MLIYFEGLVGQVAIQAIFQAIARLREIPRIAGTRERNRHDIAVTGLHTI